MSKIILKVDDWNGITNYKQKFFHMLVMIFKIKVNWGIMGYAFSKFNTRQINIMKKLLNTGLYSFFNHGYFHNIDEFKHLCKLDQIYHIKETNKIVEQKLSIKLTAFGAPCNSLNEDSLDALNECNDIDFWLFGNDNFKRINIKRILDIEYPFFHPSYINFLKNYENHKHQDILCLQIHPNQWSFLSFINFILIILKLKTDKHNFIFINELNNKI